MDKGNSLKDPKDLIQRAKNGNREAFGELYELYYVPIFRYIYLRLQHKSETEDLVQIVFLKVYQKVGKYEEQGKDPLAYFFTVARNTLIDYFRKKKELNLDETKLEDEKGLDLEESVEKEVNLQAIKKALKYLTKDQQEVIILKFINDWSNKKIGEFLKKSEDAVRQIQSRALKALKEHLKDSKII